MVHEGIVFLSFFTVGKSFGAFFKILSRVAVG
jgi:hypothetical protein